MKALDKMIYAMMAIVVLTLSGCQDNGYIGRLYGTWRFASYSVDGVEIVGAMIEESTISFQNNITSVTTFVDEYLTDLTYYGTWKEEGDQFTLDFTHHDDVRPGGGDVYSAPTWLGMTAEEPMVMRVSESTSRAFTLTWTDPQGAVKVYRLKKTW